MKIPRILSNTVGFPAISAIDRRKAELVKSVALLACGNLAVYAGAQAASGDPKLFVAALSLIPFLFAMLGVLWLNHLGRRMVAQWLLMTAISSGVATQVFIFHGTDVRTYFFFGCAGIVAPVILPWRHRMATLFFVALHLFLFVWLDSVELHVSPELIAAHESWTIRTLNAWARATFIVTIAILTWKMEFLTRRTERELEALAITDALTGLLNRRGVDALLKHELATASRRHTTLWLAVIDIDHFKLVNDRFSHAIGDSALRQVAQTLSAQAREGDFVARWGGEEFLVVMPSCGDANGAATAAERMRQSVAAGKLAMARAAPLTVTISIGVAGVPPDGDLASAIAQADQALYRAKSSGRNRVVVADGPHGILARSANDAGTTTGLA